MILHTKTGRASGMSRKLFGLLVIAATTLTSGTYFSQTRTAACDRACLRTMLDQYLNAVVKHDPAAAPLVVGFRQTENAINTRPGNGIWKTVSGLGKVQRRYLDPVTQQAVYFGTVDEAEGPAIVTVRIRVENRKLTEAEWYVARASDPGLSGPRQPGRGPANGYNVDYLTQNPPAERVVPVAQRTDRDGLMRIVDSYFDAITSHDGTVALTHAGCGRVENGSPTPAGQFLPPATPAGQQANAGGRGAAAPAGARGAAGAAPAAGAPPANAPRGGAAAPAGGARGAAGGGGNDCVGGLQNFSGQMAAARRMPVVDEEAQVVLAYAVFIRRAGVATPRNTFSELFMIDDAKIRTVYAAMFYPAPDLAVPNWPPYTGNWPLPPAFVPLPGAPAQQ